MTIYCKDVHRIVDTAGADILICGSGNAPWVCLQRPGEMCEGMRYQLPLTSWNGQTTKQCEALVEAIAEAERDGKPFITVCGGEVVEDQSGGEDCGNV